MKKPLGTGPSREPDVNILRGDRRTASEYARLVVDGLNDSERRGDSLLALLSLAKAFRGLDAVASKAGISRESLYRSLSPKGNPTLKTLVAVLNTMGLSLSVVPQQKKARKRTARKPAKTVRVRSRAAA